MRLYRNRDYYKILEPLANIASDEEVLNNVRKHGPFEVEIHINNKFKVKTKTTKNFSQIAKALSEMSESFPVRQSIKKDGYFYAKMEILKTAGSVCVNIKTFIDDF
jgi:hypothetical protein